MNEQEKSQESKEEKSSDNVIFVGGKPFMNYITGVVMQFNNSDRSEVHIKSRGKFITKAVDVAEVARRKFLKDLNVTVKNVSIGSEEFTIKDKTVNVSTLEITLVKN